MLIVGRALSGVGAAGLRSGGAVIVSYCVTLRKRPILMELLFMMYGAGSVTQPLIGGNVTDRVIEALGEALRDVFLLTLASAIITILMSSVMEWRKLPQETESGSGSELE